MAILINWMQLIYPKAPLDSYKKIAKALDNSIIDSVSIEDAHCHNDLSLLKDFKKTKVIFWSH